MAEIVIFADQPDWHIRRLAAALRERGLAPLQRSLRDCAFMLGAGGSGIAIPGLEGRLPAAVLARTIARGSFEQITLRLSLLHALAFLGIPVVNEARAIERCVDKSMTSFLLHRAGIPTPATIATENEAAARQHLEGAPAEQVQKPLFGSQGRGLARLAAGEAPRTDDEFAGVFYVQRFVAREGGWRDFRVMVVGGRAIAAMRRHGRSWITNVHQGARCEPVAMTNRLAELSLAAVEAVGADYAGVDLIEDDAGELLVLEVNSTPAWKGLQSVASCDIAAAIAAHVARRIA